MKILVCFSVVPIGVESSVSKYVAECGRILQAAGLTFSMHANGTDVEGEWDEVFTAIRRCIERLQAMGVPRAYTVMTMDARFDRQQSLETKLASLEFPPATSDSA